MRRAIVMCGCCLAIAFGPFIASCAADDAAAQQELIKRAAEIEATSNVQPANSDPEVARIALAWEHRSQAIRTSRISWTQRRTDRRGAMNGIATMRLSDERVVPPEDVTFELTEALLFKEDRIRYERQGMTWLQGSESLVKNHSVHGYGKGQVRFYSEHPDRDNDASAGLIANDSGFDRLKAIDLMPLSLVLGPFDAGIGSWDKSQLSRAPEHDKADSLCLRLNGAAVFMWVSKSIPTKLLRYETRRNDDSVATQTDIDWRELDGTWIPNQWLLTQFGSNREILRVKEFIVREFALNPPLDDRDLEVSFPRGIKVRDDVSGFIGIVDELGQVVPIESGATWLGRNSLALGVVLVLAAVAYFVRRLKPFQRTKMNMG